LKRQNRLRKWVVRARWKGLSSAMIKSDSIKTTSRLRLVLAIVILVALHLWALFIMVWSEPDWAGKAAFLLAWGVLNCFWILLLRRPAPAAGLAVALLMSLIALSAFKKDVLGTTVTFIDVLIVDIDTMSFLFKTFDLAWHATVVALITALLVFAFFLLDPLRVRFRTALAGLIVCFALLAALSFAVPYDYEQELVGNRFLSKFARSGAVSTIDLVTRGVLEADAKTTERLVLEENEECQSPAKLPHIILIFDESSFDATLMPGVRVRPNYQQHFRSFDGKERKLLVEGAGGPSWFTEYNILTGLSVRSYGRFANAVTRIAPGRIDRGLAHALRRCGYRTFSMYTYYGDFIGAKRFHTSAGVERFFDAKDLGGFLLADSQYYDFALRTLFWERTGPPLFLFVQTAANHFPWDFRYQPNLLADWRNLGNRSDVDEYLRRQAMSAQDYSRFVARLREEFPGEPFLVVRFGDHQPKFAKYLVDPTLEEASVAKRIETFDPRYLTTYYAVDLVNFTPADLSSALDTLDAPYLPLFVLEAAGVPLDASFAEQKKILQRCDGLFYACKDGAEARRFNRLLIDAGLINGL
jgi:phosphoglycerol transferase MdoB-like AlkP superfamily enzyme